LITNCFLSQNNIATIIVDETDSINAVHNTLLGYNNNWYVPEMMFENDNITYRTEFEDIYSQCSHHLQRMSGTASQHHDWKLDTVMPPTNRQSQLDNWGNPYIPYYGIVEWILKVREYNPDAKFIWTLNMTHMSSVDHADLVEFLLYEGSGNPNAGVDWKQVRINLGLGTSAVNIEFIELGNELDIGGHQFTIQQYIDSCQNAINAMLAVVPGIKFSAHVATGPWNQSNSWKSWHRDILQSLSDDLDYLSFHAYYEGIAIKTMELDYIKHIRQDIHNPIYSNNSDINIVITEHARWINSNTHSDDNLKGSIAKAHLLARLMQNKTVTHANYHGLLVRAYNAMGPYSSNVINRYKGGPFEVSELFSKAFSNSQAVVSSLVSGDLTDWMDAQATLIHSVIKRKDGGLNLIIVNKSDSLDRNINLSFNGTYYLNKKIIITAANMSDYNDHNQQPITSNETIVNDSQPLSSYLIYKQSVTVLFLDNTPVNTNATKDYSNKLNIKPNPMRNSSIIEFNNPNNTLSIINIYDLNGKRVLKVIRSYSNFIELKKERLCSGIYLIQLQNKQHLSYGKLVVE